MESIDKVVTFNKGGGSSSSSSGRIILPKEFLEFMKVTKEEPNVKVYYENDSIIIRKSETQPEFKFTKDIDKLLDIKALLQLKDRKETIKRLLELEEYRDFLRHETMSQKEYDYRYNCFEQVAVVSDLMYELGSTLEDFEEIKKKYNIPGLVKKDKKKK